jgi:cellulose synthase/poly-beta-1,6-N-acetylglucosamine synthase-like glycosyltransferase
MYLIAMNPEIETLILVILGIYFALGFSQLITARNLRREACLRKFSRKEVSVSVIIPVREVTPTTREDIESVCIQDYRNYEVIFVAELKEHPAYNPAREMELRYPHVQVHVAGPHNSQENIAKCHNLLLGVKKSSGDVLLFGDSDVTYSPDWISKMTAPLGETIEGRNIDAVTSPFFIDTLGPLGKFIALSVTFVTYTTSFASRAFRFPPYISGASMAISKRTFYSIGMDKIWRNTFNDDLVLANTLQDWGHVIYNQYSNLNHTNEAFPDFTRAKEKMVRWIITVSRFGHKKFRQMMPLLVVKNLQFQVSLVLSIILLLLGFSWLLALGVFASGYAYSVIYRYLIGRFIGEKSLGLYYLITPLSTTSMMLVYYYVRTFHKTFPWGSGTYTVKERYSR